MQKKSFLMDTGPPLLLSSLRLLVPPLRLVSAAIWQIVQRRDVMNYGLVEEFVTTVLEVAPDIMRYRDRVRLIMGLRAQLVLELCRSDHLADHETIQPHLNRIHTCIISCGDQEISDPEVEASESTFLKLVQTLLEDPVEKEHFFQSVFAKEFGPIYDSALQALVWEFLSVLDKILPSPSLQQTTSWFLPDPAVLEECVQCVCHSQPLKNILQHHRHDNTTVRVDTRAGPSGDDQILSPTSLSRPEASDAFAGDPEIKSEPMQGCMSPVSSDNEAEITPVLDHIESNKLSVNEEAKPAFSGVFCIRDKKAGVVKHKALGKGRRTNCTKVGTNYAFRSIQIHSGLTIHGKAHYSKQEMLVPMSEVSLERLRIGSVGPRGKREERVTAQPSQSNKPIDGPLQDPIAPDPTSAQGQPKRSTRVKVCSLCGKSFSKAKDLTAHMRCHTEPSLYRCTRCGRDFGLLKDFQKHQQSVCEKSAPPRDMSTRSLAEDDTPATLVGHDGCEVAQPPGPLPQSKRGPYVRHATKVFQPSKARQVCHVCDRTLCNLFMLRRHIKSVHGLLPYMCHNCEESFGNNPDLKRHVKECLKLKKRQTCSLCGGTFIPTLPTEHLAGNQQTSVAVKEHVLGAPRTSSAAPPNTMALNALPVMTPSSSNYRTCLLCDETFDTVANLRKHLKFHHDVHPYPCIHCGESFPNVSDLQMHECSGRNIPDSRKCTGCRNRTSQSAQQQLKTGEAENLRRVRADWPTICGGNDTELNSTDIGSNGLPQHRPDRCENVNIPIGQQDHHPEEDPTDGSSAQEAGTPSSESTQNPTTSDVPHARTCSVRNKTRDAAGLLQRHGPGQGRHTCSICSRSFSQALFLTRHQGRKNGCGPMRRNRVVYEDVPADDAPVFPCPHCQECFGSRGKLETHAVCHTGDGFDCRFCGKTFAEQYKLYTHVRSHVHRPHLCDSCGKDFRTKYALTVHLRVHTGERPFSCPSCGKSCSSKGNLKAHQRVHSGERPFACTFCKVRCRIKSQLKIHMLTHTGERPHKCLACGKTFQLKFLLRKHLLASCS